MPYDVEGKIENTFKQEGENFVEDIGNLNNGTDYEKNERNIYDLYIPEYALNRQKEANGIILWIHGGAWIEGDLKDMNSLLLSKFDADHINTFLVKKCWRIYKKAITLHCHPQRGDSENLGLTLLTE